MSVLFLEPIVIHPFGILTMVAGLFSILLGYKFGAGARRVAEQDPEPIKRLTPGLVEVSGVARPIEDGETIPAHLSGEEALVSEFLLDRKEASKSRSSFSHHWSSLRVVPFEVDDGTATVRVDVPPGTSFLYEHDFEKPSFLGGTPDAVQDLLESADDVEQINEGLSGIRYNYRWKTGAVTPGDSVYVRGWAVPSDTEWGETNVKITGDEQLEEFIVSTLSEKEVIARRKVHRNRYYLVGTVVFLLGVAFSYRPILALFG